LQLTEFELKADTDEKEDTDDTKGVDIDDITTYDRAGARADATPHRHGAYRRLVRDHPLPAPPL